MRTCLLIGLNSLTSKVHAYLLSTRIEEIVAKTAIRLQQVRLDATRGLHCHLGSVLQDEDGELRAWHTGQPEAEVAMDSVRVNLLH